jgi:hypothetical protein
MEQTAAQSVLDDCAPDVVPGAGRGLEILEESLGDAGAVG